MNVLVSQLVLRSVEDNLRITILLKKPSFYKETAFFAIELFIARILYLFIQHLP